MLWTVAVDIVGQVTGIMYRMALVFTVVLLITGCKESKEDQEQGAKSMIDESEYAFQRKEVLESIAGGPLCIVDVKAVLEGRWDVYFRNPISPDIVSFIYTINADGALTITHVELDAPPEEGTWKLNNDGTLSIFLKIPPDPTTPTLEKGTIAEECYLLFSLDKNCLILSNYDTSVVQVLRRIK
ncbi:MAG: hypothetical protein ACYSWP_12275 [Planctomycetota bacterium]|jgi:hypothetical protein